MLNEIFNIFIFLNKKMKVKFSKNLFQSKNQISKICSLSFSPTNKNIAVACQDNNIYLFNEQGEIKETLSTLSFGPKTKAYEIIQIQFNQEGNKIAVAQSNDIIYVTNLGERISSCNKFIQDARPTCLIWPRPKEIFFGLYNGKIKKGLIDNNSTEFLYKYESPCVSISSSLDKKYIISGHEDSFILIYNIENNNFLKLCVHSCIPTCLVWGKGSNILSAGNNYKVIIYTDKGKEIQNFDYSKDNNIKEFGCFGINETGDAIALGNFNSFYIYLFNEKKTIMG